MATIVCRKDIGELCVGEHNIIGVESLQRQLDAQCDPSHVMSLVLIQLNIHLWPLITFIIISNTTNIFYKTMKKNKKHIGNTIS